MPEPKPHTNSNVHCPHRLSVAAALLSITLLLTDAAAHAQLPAGTTDASSSSSQTTTPPDPLRTQATDALDRQDFPTALKLLTTLADRNPTDPHVLFDLASAQDALSETDPSQTSTAVATYRRAIAADPTYFEPHLALGLLLARNHQTAAARSELLTAVTLNAPDSALKARAYRALAHLDQTLNPAESRDALLNALKLSPETDDDTLLSAALAEAAHDAPSAEAAYRRILARSPGDPSATAALAHLLLASNGPGSANNPPGSANARATEVEALLTEALADHPNDPILSSQLVSLYVRQGNPTAALALAEKLHAARPADTDLTRLYARLLSQTGDYARAEPLFAQLSAQSPVDSTLLDDRADALIHLQRPAEAQPLLQRAIAQPAAFPTPSDLGNAASHLAFAATQNNQPEVALQALALRATVLPQSPATLFLAASANDKLHRVRQATDLYKEFLATANGKFPDEEFEARDRLVALAHTR